MKHEHIFNLKSGLLLAALLFFSTAVFCQADTAKISLFETRDFYSKILTENRRIHIYVPKRPVNNGVYPVLYVLDGEAMMSMVAGQIQYLSESYKVVPSMIIVGIENTHRTRDLTPTHSIAGPDGKPDTSQNAFGKNSGGGGKFLEFIKSELMPYVNVNYPAAPYNVLYGHSLGGLTALHDLANSNRSFNAYIALSPSLQWDDRALLKQFIQKKYATPLKGYLFLSDANEGNVFHQNLVQLDSSLKQQNNNLLNFKYSSYPEETHLSGPVPAFYHGIRFIFSDWYLNYNSSAFRKTMTAKTVIDHYQNLSKKYGYTVVPLQDEINSLATMFRRDPKKIPDAIEILETGLKHYASSPFMLELLADTWLLSGDPKRALSFYEKALLQNKDSAPLKQKIQKINTQN